MFRTSRGASNCNLLWTLFFLTTTPIFLYADKIIQFNCGLIFWSNVDNKNQKHISAQRFLFGRLGKTATCSFVFGRYYNVAEKMSYYSSREKNKMLCNVFSKYYSAMESLLSLSLSFFIHFFFLLKLKYTKVLLSFIDDNSITDWSQGSVIIIIVIITPFVRVWPSGMSPKTVSYVRIWCLIIKFSS